MENLKNPFAELEPDATCPPNVQKELVAEIDTIRNSLKVVETFTNNFLSLFPALMNYLDQPLQKTHNQQND